MTRTALLLACALALPAAAQQTQKSAQTKPAEESAKKSGMAALADPASLNERAPDRFQVSFFTTKGEFLVEARREWSPHGVDRFYNLVKNGFYDDVAFFRVVPGFVVQFGLSGHPKINQKLRAARITDDAVVKSNQRGYLTFAKSGAPNSRTTQLFVNYGDNGRLDAMGFAPIAMVLGDGMKVVDAINSQYREQPSQGRIMTQGNDYLRQEFPELDYVLAATIVE